MLKKWIKAGKGMLLALLAITVFSVGPYSAFGAQQSNVHVVQQAVVNVNGEKVKLDDPLHIVNGRIYLPVAHVAQLLSGSIKWNSKYEEATIITKSNDEVILGNGVPIAYFNDKRYVMEAEPYLYEGRMYVPVKYAVEFLHATLNWDGDSNTLHLQSVPLVEVTEQNTVFDIANQYGIVAADLVVSNGYSKAVDIKPGTQLRVIIPSIFENRAEDYTQEEFMLLAKLVQIEAGHESYEGQLAVANVILNRVKHQAFPNSIKEVIYSGKQFPPAHNGLLDKSKPNESVLKATKDALNGKNNVEKAIYFYNPKYSSGPFWSSLTVEASIGNHKFAY